MRRPLIPFVLIAAATITAVSAIAQHTSLAGSDFDVRQIGETVIDGPDHLPFLAFGADGRVSGTSGCNQLTGNFSQDGDTLSFGPLAMTRMLCGEKLDAQERLFVQAIGQVAAVREEADGVLLLGADGTELMQLARR